MSGYLPPTGAQEQLFCRRVADAVRRCDDSGRAQYLGFLDERQQALAQMQLARSQWPQHLFFGGYPDAERKVLAVCLDAPEPVAFPLCCLRIDCRGAALTHRDYLGAVLGLGLERECLGDILPDAQGAYLFALRTQAQLILRELTEVGREKAAVSLCEAPPQLAPSEGESLSASVASLRLDAVLAALLHKNREDAADLVRGQRVQVNHVLRTEGSAALAEGDLITVRGFGRFLLEKAGDKTRKGRTFISYRKY